MSPDDEDLLGVHEPAGWAEQRAAEQAGGRYADELLAQPEAVVRAALYLVAEHKPASFILAKNGPSKEALDIQEEVQKLRVRAAARLQHDQELRPDQAPPELVSLTTFLEEPDEDVRYRVDGLWPREGRIVLAAQNKSGKTTLTGNLIRSLVDGDAFLDRFEVEPVDRVVLIDNELSPTMIRRWLGEQGIRKTGAVDLVSLRGRLSSFSILDPATRTEWAERIGPADVLIFDCLRPALDALGLSEDKESGRFLEALDELCHEARIGELLLVHHMGHSNERSRGDSRLEDWPDAKWKLVREDHDDLTSPTYFTAFGRDVNQPEVRLAYAHPDRHLSVDGGSRRQARTSQIESEIQIWLADHAGSSQNAIEAGVGGDRNLVRKAIKALAAGGWIRIEKAGQRNAHYISENGSNCPPEQVPR